MERETGKSDGRNGARIPGEADSVTGTEVMAAHRCRGAEGPQPILRGPGTDGRIQAPKSCFEVTTKAPRLHHKKCAVIHGCLEA